MYQYSIIPLTSEPDQRLRVTIPIDGKNVTLRLRCRYNSIASCWMMTISDDTGNVLLDSLPLLPGDYPAGDLLRPHRYLGLGSACLVNAGAQPTFPSDGPTSATLGSGGWQLIWGSTAP
jgi:hypothetical protein